MIINYANKAFWVAPVNYATSEYKKVLDIALFSGVLVI
jgi:hypothetical protein